LQVPRHHFNSRRRLIVTLSTTAVLAVFGVSAMFHVSYSSVFYSRALRKLYSPQNVSHLLLKNRTYHTGIPYIINQEKLCGSKAVDYLFIVMSAVENFENRIAIRETWGKEVTVFARGRLLFVVGRDDDGPQRSQLEKESYVSMDIVQVDLLDIAEHHVLKTVTMLQWATKHCHQAKFVIKAKDETFVHVANLLKTTHSKSEDAVYADTTGPLFVVRGVNQKMITKMKAHAQDGFSSGMYIIGGRAVELLYKATGHVKPIHPDDSYLTELCAVSVGVPRFRITGIDGNGYYSNCMANSALYIHPVTARRIQELWRD
ncbi:unnamed protein product, partial [Ixodes hexagonus]